MQDRKFLSHLILSAILILGAGQAFSQGDSYPARTITMIVPTAPGGTTDISARMLATPLGAALGQTIVVENKGGGNGNIAASQVKRAPPDGYMIMMQYSGYHVITPHVSKQQQWEQKDFQAVANVISAPQIIVIRADLPFKTFKEFIAFAKANPGKLNYASSGNGSLQHVTGAMLEQQAGIKMAHIPYKGTGPALQDLLAGQVDITFGTAPPFMQHVATGRLRVLAVTGKTRLPSLPDVPTTAEVGYPKVDATSWFGVFAPAGVPKPIIDKLSAEIAKVVQSPAFKQRAVELGATADYENPKQFSDHVATELVGWAGVVKAAKIEAE